MTRFITTVCFRSLFANGIDCANFADTEEAARFQAEDIATDFHTEIVLWEDRSDDVEYRNLYSIDFTQCHDLY